MRNLKRALSLGLTAAMISGLMIMGSSAAGYADVTSEQNQEAIEVLQAVGIMVGDENGNFNPDATVSRNEMAVVMSNLMEYNVASYANTSPFTDVPEWAEPYVAACWTNGITAGYSDTTYGGSDSVTTAQAALMVMKALGYFQYEQDFGNDWQLATITKANDIDLFDDVDSGVREAMTRNDLAQLVLNTLEAGTVRASTSGNITVGGVTIATSVEYNFVTSTRSYARAIGTSQDTSNSSDAQAYVVELGESLYQGELKKTESQDDFGRPANIWEYESKEIGTYADVASATWTVRVNERDLYSAAGSAAVNEYTWHVYEDGEEIASFDYEDNHDLMPTRSGSDRWNGTGNGILTEVFVDSQKDQVIVTKINTWLAEVTKVEENEDDYTVTVSYKTQPSSRVSREFDTTTEFAREDIVLVTLAGEAGATKEIQSLDLAETVEGTVNSVRNADYLRIDGTTYNYNYGYTSGDRILAALYDLDDNTAGGKNPEAGDDCTIYLDAYGNAIAVENADITADDYLYVLGIDDPYGDISAKVIFSDGTEQIIEIDEVNGDDATSGSSYGTTSHDVVQGHVYRFSQSGSQYDLVSAGSEFAENALKLGTYAGKIENDSAAFFAGYQNSSSTGTTYTADSNTVFVDTDKNTAYIGYAEVPSMSEVEGWVVTDVGSNKAEIVFVTNAPEYDLDDDSFFFVKDLKVETEDTEDGTVYRWDIFSTGEDNTLTASSDLRNAASLVNRLDAKGMYQIKSYDSDDYVTKIESVVDIPDTFDPTAASAYATTASNGVLVVTGDANKLSSGNTSATTFTYNSDTTFMVVEMDRVKNEIGDVYTLNTPSMIETHESGSSADNTDRTAVYVINADDKDEASPKATLVLVVVPDTSVDSDTDMYTVTYPTSVSNISSISTSPSITSGNDYADGTTFTLTVVPATNYTAEVRVNGTAVTGSGNDYTITVDEDIEITITAARMPADTYDGTITIDIDDSSNSGLVDNSSSTPDYDTNAWTIDSLSYVPGNIDSTGSTAPTNTQVFKAITDWVTEHHGYTYKSVATSGSAYYVVFTDGYVDYSVKYDPSSDNADLDISDSSVTLSQPNDASDVEDVRVSWDPDEYEEKYDLVATGLSQTISGSTVSLSGTIDADQVINKDNWDTYKVALNRWASNSTDTYSSWADFVSTVLAPECDGAGKTLNEDTEISFIMVACNGRVLISCVVKDTDGGAHVLKLDGTSNTVDQIKTWRANGVSVTVDISGVKFP